MKMDEKRKDNRCNPFPAASNNLKLFLSFAVGGLLGDVFLHLLPEAWSHAKSFDDYLWTGEWALAGLLLFLFIEKIMSDESQSKELKEAEEKMHDCSGKGNRTPSKINHKEELNHNQNKDVALTKLSEPVQETRSIKISGYLNLLANIIDNFTHGLAVGGSFLVCNKVGIITTFAILVHEIPHEVGDFAILLRSGFDRWKAAKAQILTASGGLLGTITALSADSIEEAGMKTAWILPFTSGGFIYIALVSIVPELVEETEPKQSAKQIICIIAGIACMLLVTLIFE
ncbi:zinc transporter ZIP13-like [Octopus vulgaris]|uniref:Zinc transporter ZIP13-like n=1 Tax=Octopus vulgaris TaxID=6645 RepID=A0AA36EY90_OCTVU|nr:zinc transporter ZIP13-like [Octopus vulgaris]